MNANRFHTAYALYSRRGPLRAGESELGHVRLPLLRYRNRQRRPDHSVSFRVVRHCVLSSWTINRLSGITTIGTLSIYLSGGRLKNFRLNSCMIARFNQAIFCVV
ncbi:hypothetical protein SISSUDRAFT_530290 [Sistotremastrum suecicum HHB10207 ss-3]|uniref:Uncharacterized protein n=1 Tax=Sistotremastrum suecicum HHB10207 ss-3 TaxID=1314776 RepID=A0A166F329_9AGAM|nr:hypothetical protein SISSUDRAFT_530290 [Sistotremastrum suecicum HHB10207 ss-3]